MIDAAQVQLAGSACLGDGCASCADDHCPEGACVATTPADSSQVKVQGYSLMSLTAVADAILG